MTPELLLVVACCRWPDDDARASRIGDAAALVADWEEVAALARRHRVEPLVAHGLAAADIAVPQRLATLAEAARAQSVRDLAEYLRIAAAMDGAGIAHHFLKGAPLGAVAYGSPLLKRSWDIDLLVEPRDAVAAAAVLHQIGYAPVMPPRALDAAEFARWSKVSKEAEYRAAWGTTVELHWRVSDHPALLGTVTAASPARSVALLGEHCVPTLADPFNLAYLAVHGTGHAWFRLKWIADFHALLASIDGSAERATVLEQAAALPVGRALDCALLLAGRLFGEAFAIGESPAAKLARASLAALGEPDETVANARSRPLRWRLAPGFGFRWRELAIRWRGTRDRAEHPLPRGLGFLYPWLRIPFWVARKLANSSPQQQAGIH